MRECRINEGCHDYDRKKAETGWGVSFINRHRQTDRQDTGVYPRILKK